MLLGVSVATLAVLVYVASRQTSTATAGTPAPPLPATPTTSTPTAVHPSTIGSVLVLGDSLSAGIGASTPAAGYVGDAKAAVGGNWNVQAKPNQTHDTVFGAAVFPPSTDAVIVELGTNDWNTRTADQFAPLYAQRMTDLRARYPQALIVCVGIWQNPRDVKTVPYDQAIEATCGTIHGAFVRISDLFPEQSLHQADANRFHPNDAGYTIIATRLEGALRG